MADIKITKLLELGGFSHFSASRAERGGNAGIETWQNSVDEAKAHRVMKPAEREAFRDHMRGYGAWDDEEIDAWTAYECDALLIQLASGDMREMQSLCPGDGLFGIDWDEAETLAHAGTIAGRIYVNGKDAYISID